MSRKASSTHYRLLALDFDGVLFNSIEECIYSTYLTLTTYYVGIGGEGSAPAPGPQLFLGDKSFFREVFLRYRYLVRQGSEFGLLFALPHLLCPNAPGELLSARPTVTAADFARLAAEQSEFVAEFGRHFYQIRESLLQEPQRQLWLHTLNVPYQDFWKSYQLLTQAFAHLAICTTKSEPFVTALLDTIDSPALKLAELPILGLNFNPNKIRQLEHLRQRFELKASEMIFLDDLLANLLHVQQTGVKLMLADWGYESAENKQKARALGIPVVTCRELAVLAKQELLQSKLYRK